MALPWFAKRLIATNRRLWEIIGTVAANTWRDGFIHAGNLAYLSLLTLFPFFLVVGAVAGAFGRTEDGLRAVKGFLALVPPDVAALLVAPIEDVIHGASGRLLTIGILVTLWTVSGTIETIRDILRRAYRTEATLAVWRYRLSAIGIIFAAVLLMFAAFAVQVAATGIEAVVVALIPAASDAFSLFTALRLVPIAALFVSLYLIFYILTPHRFRGGGLPIWPGPLLITIVWIGTTRVLPATLALFGGYGRTYGSLAGVIVALLFFYIIGLGLVIGAQLNAALALVPRLRQKPGEG